MMQTWDVKGGQCLHRYNSLVFVANLFSYTFIVMITLIAVANVFNTISTNIRLQLAMLRSVGMGNRAFYRMMRYESAFYGIFAMIFGLLMGVLLSCGIQNMMLEGVVEAEGAAFRFPWTALAVSICGVLGIVFVTMRYTIAQLNRENIIDALRDELA